MKLLALGLCAISLVFAAVDRDGNFTIRFEPEAKLQAKVPVPFTVRVNDDLGKPLQEDDHVDLAIAPENEEPGQGMKAWFIEPGVFIVKPVFPSDGQWAVTVTARRQHQVSRRTITFSVSQ